MVWWRVRRRPAVDKTQTAAGIVVRAENERTARAVGSLNNECTNLPRSSRCLPSRSNPREPLTDSTHRSLRQHNLL